MAYDVVIKDGRIYDGSACLRLQVMWQSTAPRSWKLGGSMVARAGWRTII